MKNNPTYLFAGQNAENAIQWFKGLASSQKMALKELCSDIVGVGWSELTKLLTPRERLGVLYDKVYMMTNNIEWSESMSMSCRG